MFHQHRKKDGHSVYEVFDFVCYLMSQMLTYFMSQNAMLGKDRCVWSLFKIGKNMAATSVFVGTLHLLFHS